MDQLRSRMIYFSSLYVTMHLIRHEQIENDKHNLSICWESEAKVFPPTNFHLKYNSFDGQYTSLQTKKLYSSSSDAPTKGKCGYKVLWFGSNLRWNIYVPDKDLPFFTALSILHSDFPEKSLGGEARSWTGSANGDRKSGLLSLNEAIRRRIQSRTLSGFLPSKYEIEMVAKQRIYSTVFGGLSLSNSRPVPFENPTAPQPAFSYGVQTCNCTEAHLG